MKGYKGESKEKRKKGWEVFLILWNILQYTPLEQRRGEISQNV